MFISILKHNIRIHLLAVGVVFLKGGVKQKNKCFAPKKRVGRTGRIGRNGRFFCSPYFVRHVGLFVHVYL